MINDVLYNMALHERTVIQDSEGFYYSILRVPGGWLYKFKDRETFVPYNIEFNEKEKRRLQKEYDKDWGMSIGPGGVG